MHTRESMTETSNDDSTIFAYTYLWLLGSSTLISEEELLPTVPSLFWTSYRNVLLIHAIG